MKIVSRIRPVDLPEAAAPEEFLYAGLEPLVAFAHRATALETALADLAKVAGDAGRQAVEQLQAELREFEPAITILGQVKSGKTTLVNALAGWSDLLPSDVNPWTSVVTSLHLVPGLHRRDVGARFQLILEDEWDRLLKKGGRLGELAQRADAGGEMEKIRQQIAAMREKSRNRLGKKFELMLGQVHEYGYFDRNLLERYICLGDEFLTDSAAAADDKQGWFADITRSADLYLDCQTIPYQVCLRDTPGVNDTFLVREQVTINAVRDSRICVVVLSAHQALTTTDMGLIRLISTLRSRNVIIFVNRIDELADPSRQVVEIEQSIRETLRRHNGPEDAEIIFGSAYWANKVLSESINEIGKASAAALVNWAETGIPSSELESSPTALVWLLSGLPRLNRAIANQIVSSLGDAHLRKIAGAAITIAGGLHAANLVRVEGKAGQAAQSLPDALGQMDALRHHHRAALAEELGAITTAFHDRADRAHANFLERATLSLVRHLEESGNQEVWEYDPTGLRMLLKSAYSVYAARAQSAATARFQAAVQDVAELLYTAFGEAVAGIELAVPEVPEAPAPTALAQTIVLDFNDGWWVSWWRRTRGYKAFSEKFYAMIDAETQDFMVQFKSAPPAELNARLEALLAAFLDQSRSIIVEIGSGGKDKDHLQDLIPGGEMKDRRKTIDRVTRDLRSHIEQDGKGASRP